MPPTTNYKFGDVILVPFPFTDQSGAKNRPAVVVSSAAYNSGRPDVILMAITSQLGASVAVGEVTITDWKRAGLIGYSIIKPIVTTLEKKLVLRKLGQPNEKDRKALQAVLLVIVG